jgi:hypothetical protein
MPDTVSIDEVLSKFVSNEVDSTEVLKLLLTSDETGLNYLQNLKKDFKDKYVIPTFNKAKNYYTTIEKKLEDPKNKDVLNQLGDPFGLKELHKEYKKKTKEVLQKNLDKFETNLNFDNKPATEKLNNTNISSVIPNNKQASITEQQTFTSKKQTFILADESIDKLGVVLGGINTENLKRIGKLGPEQSKQKNDGGGGGLLASLGGLLLAGGVGSLLVAAFWKDHIKPWLENKIGLKLDFFDKFQGILVGMGKFFTMGGLGATGLFLKLQGKIFTTIGDFLEGGISAIFKAGLADDVAKAGIKTAPMSFKSFIPKIAGRLFTGMGKTMLRGVPLIGSLISFYFAYDRFKRDDITGGIIDLVGGIGDLLYFTPLAPLAPIISLGAAALNGFLDYKAGAGATTEAQQSIKMDYINKIVDYIQEIPIVGGLIKFGRGFWELGKGNWRGALDYLTGTPFLGPFPAILQSLVNSNAFGTEEGEAFSFQNFSKEIKKSMFRWLCSVIPKFAGIRGRVAEWMGLEYNDETGKVEVDETPFKTQEQYDEINKNKLQTNEAENSLRQMANTPIDPNTTKYSKEDEQALEKMLERASQEHAQKWRKLESSKQNIFSGSKIGTDFLTGFGVKSYYQTKDAEEAERSSGEYVNIVKKRLEEYKKLNTKKDDVEETPTVKKRDDFSFKNLMTSTDGNSILFDKNTNTANVLHPDDNVLAYKTDGVFDKALKELTTLVQSINKGIYKLPESLNNNNNSPSSVVISNTSGGGSGRNMMDVVLSGTRPDSIYNYRRSIQGEFA